MRKKTWKKTFLSSFFFLQEEWDALSSLMLSSSSRSHRALVSFVRSRRFFASSASSSSLSYSFRRPLTTLNNNKNNDDSDENTKIAQLREDFRHCSATLRQNDYETYLCTNAIDASRRAGPLALRALNCETAGIGTHSGGEENKDIALVKLRWWMDHLVK